MNSDVAKATKSSVEELPKRKKTTPALIRFASSLRKLKKNLTMTKWSTHYAKC